MTKSIEKFKLDDKIRLLFFKYRGDLNKIAIEAKSPVEYVKKVIDKFKEEQKHNPNLFVVQYFMEYTFMGAKEREIANRDDLDKVVNYENILKSVCCNTIVRNRDDIPTQQDGLTHICLKCNRLCRTYEDLNLEIFDLKIRLREEMRKDEEHLLKAVEDLGFGERKEEVTKVQQFNYIASGKDVSEDDKKVLTDIANADPRTRERIRKEIQKTITTDTHFESTDETEQKE
jgi:hypothetical protein